MFDLGSNSNAPKYVPGYTGHIPKYWGESDFQKEKCTYYIPKYDGFVSGIKSENIHGKTFGEATAEAIKGNYETGFNHPPHKIYKSTQHEAYETGLKDYFFSFSRLTEEQKQNTRDDMRRSMQLSVPKPNIGILWLIEMCVSSRSLLATRTSLEERLRINSELNNEANQLIN